MIVLLMVVGCSSSLSFKGTIAAFVLEEIKNDVAVSAGAACHSPSAHNSEVTISAVLKAMNVPFDYAKGTLRFSTGKYLTEEQVERAIEIVAKAIQKHKK
jgi:cysteine desulfurase